MAARMDNLKAMPPGIATSHRKGTAMGGKKPGKKSGLQCVAGSKLSKGR